MEPPPGLRARQPGIHSAAGLPDHDQRQPGPAGVARTGPDGLSAPTLRRDAFFSLRFLFFLFSSFFFVKIVQDAQHIVNVIKIMVLIND